VAAKFSPPPGRSRRCPRLHVPRITLGFLKLCTAPFARPGDNRQNRRLRRRQFSPILFGVEIQLDRLALLACKRRQRRITMVRVWPVARFPLPCSVGISSNEIATLACGNFRILQQVLRYRSGCKPLHALNI